MSKHHPMSTSAKYNLTPMMGLRGEKILMISFSPFDVGLYNTRAYWRDGQIDN